MSAASEFKDFVLRGNVVDLAVGVVIGASFGTVIAAFTKDIITPLITIPGKVQFNDLQFTIGNSHFLIGDFLNNVIAFLLLAIVVFFVVVKPINWLISREKTDTPAADTTKECPECL